MPYLALVYAAQLAAYGGWYAVVAAVITTAVGAYQQKKARRQAQAAARDSFNASLKDRLVMQSTTDAVHSRGYGLVRSVDGVLFKGTWGPDSRYYVLVVSHAAHECQEIVDVYFNDLKLTLASDGANGWWVQDDPYMRRPVESDSMTMSVVGTTATAVLPHTPIAGTVFISASSHEELLTPTSVVGNTVTATVGAGATASCSYQYVDAVPKARIWKYLGTASQNIGVDLLQARFPALVNTPGFNDRFAGRCCTVVELEFDQEAFPAGIPNVTATLRGAAAIDPRTGLATWSQNPAVIAYDWSLYANGGALPASAVNRQAFIAAANACDVLTNFSTPSGVETRPLYQCNIVCRLDVNPDRYLDEMVEAMAGKWGYSNGVLTVVAGVYRAPVQDITPEWITDVESIAVVPQPSRSDLVNVYRPTIADAAQDFVGVPVAEVRSAAYIAADGEVLSRELELGGVSHNVHAQHVCGVLMRDGRDAFTLQLPCNARAWPLQLFDVVTVTLPMLGIYRKEFELLNKRAAVEMGAILTLKETAASIFDPASTFNNPNASPNSALVLPWSVSPITGLTITSGTPDLDDGTNQSRTRVSWDPVLGENVRQSGRIEVQYAVFTSATLTWVAAPSASGDQTEMILVGLQQGISHLFRARAVTTLNTRSVWSYHEPHNVAEPPKTGRTVLMVPYNVTSTNVTGRSGVPNNYSNAVRWTPVGTYTFTAPSTGAGFVNLNFTASFNGTVATGCQIRIAIDLTGNGNTADDLTFEDYSPVTGSVSYAKDLSARMPFQFTAGASYTWPIYAQGLDAITLTVTDFSLQIEIVAD